MDLVPYNPDMAQDIADLYNDVVARLVPRCYPVTTAHLAVALHVTCGGPSENPLLHSQAAFVATDKGKLAGFVHVAIGRNNKNESEDHGQITFLCYRPPDRLIGQALLSQAECYLKRHGASDAIAFLHEHRYPFYYRDSACLSNHLGHIVALLGVNGYRFFRAEIMMEMMDYLPPPSRAAQPPVEIRVDEKSGPGKLPKYDIDLFLDGRQIGGCECRSCAQFGSAEELHLWWLPQWFWIHEDHQGKGLGRFLLRTALRQMHTVGYRHAAISTGSLNHRAALLYTSEGYRVIDYTCAYRRELNVGPQNKPDAAEVG